MSNSDNYLKILEKMAEIQSGVARVETKVENLEDDVREIKVEDTRQNELLAEHIAGVQTNRERLELEIQTRNEILQRHEVASQERFTELDKRLQVVEFLPNLLKGLKKLMLWLGAVTGAGYAIGRFFGLF